MTGIHSDTKAQVISTYHDHPTFSCATCAATIVRYPLLRRNMASDILTAGPSGRANQQVFLWEGWAWIVSDRLWPLDASVEIGQSSLMHSATNLKMGKKEERGLL